MPVKLYNTLKRRVEVFKPIKKNKVGLYTCGPTVYNYAHIGNLRTYLFEDLLKRVLLYNDFKTKHVMNITDVGHLTDDADAGEDKIEKGARREGKSAREIAGFYTKAFKHDLNDLNIIPPDKWCKATDHIRQQIKLVKKLVKQGFTYQTSDGVYFDTSKFKDYGQLANLKNQKLAAGKRVALGEKKHPTDFALWKFSPAKGQRQMEWDSPWGKGFPGWHLECSAMSVKYLGQPFDIHCGGIDHVPVHHTNEMAQSQAANNKPLANYWLHGEYLLLKKGKMAKSQENFITLQSIKDKGFAPLTYRYFLLQTHYRKQLTFTWEALEGAQNGLNHLYNSARQLNKKKTPDKMLKEKFRQFVNDDLYLPGALGLIWDAIKDRKICLPTLLQFDHVLGLKIREHLESKPEELPDQVIELIKARDAARQKKNWHKSDELRDELKALGYKVEDSPQGTTVKK